MPPRRPAPRWLRVPAWLLVLLLVLVPVTSAMVRGMEAKPGAAASAKLTSSPDWPHLVAAVRAATRACLETVSREDCDRATEANETLQAATSRGRAPDCGVRSAMLTVDLAFYEVSATPERRRSAQRNLEELGRECL